MSRTLDLEKTVDNIIDMAKEDLERNGKVSPICFLISEEDVKIAPFSFGNEREKIESAKRLRRVVTVLKPSAIICIFEAWMAELEEGEKWDNRIPVRKMPNKAECIIIEGVMENGKEICCVQKFGRDEKNNPILKGDVNKTERGYSRFLSGIYERDWYSN